MTTMKPTKTNNASFRMQFQGEQLNVWLKPKFFFAQSNDDERPRAKSVEHFQLLPGFIQLQEQVSKSNH